MAQGAETVVANLQRLLSGMAGVDAKGLQRYLCKSCGHTFSGIDGFTGGHFKPEVIVRALSIMMAVKMLYYEVCGHLKMLFVIILRLLGGRIIIRILWVDTHLRYVLMQDISST